MAKIITNSAMNGNIYRNIFEPLVASFNSNQKTKPSPHQVWLAATMLRWRTNNWGANIPIDGSKYTNKTTSGGARISANNCKEGKSGCSYEAIQSARNAGGKGAAYPITNVITTLEQKLVGLRMSGNNNWNMWNKGLDYFFNACSLSLTYFTYTYKNGASSAFFEEAVGLFNHPNSYKTGLQFGNKIKGSDGPDKAITTITVDTVAAPGDDKKYWTMFSDATNRTIVWIEVDASGAIAPVVAPIVGITDYYLKLALTSGGTPADQSIAITGQLNSDPGWLFDIVTSGGISDVIVTNLAVGSVTASDFTNMPSSGTWVGSFIDGDIDGAIAFETFTIDYWRPTPATDLANRFFILYDTVGDSTLLWYDLDGGGVQPVITADNYVSIPITTGMTAAEIQEASRIILDGLVFLTASAEGTKLVLTYTIADAVTNYDTGTSSFGVNYEYSDLLLGSDGSTLASGIVSAETYAEAWNEFKVDFELTQGNFYPYLNANLPWIGSLTARGGVPCYVCLGRAGICWTGVGTNCTECRSCGSKSTNAMFRTSTFSSNRRYTPGNIFLIAESNKQNKITPISELV